MPKMTHDFSPPACPGQLRDEIADLLAAGYMRLRKRRLHLAAGTFSEKELDDVAPRGKLADGDGGILQSRRSKG